MFVVPICLTNALKHTVEEKFLMLIQLSYRIPCILLICLFLIREIVS